VDTVTGPVAPSRGHVLAGAAANPDARSLLGRKTAPAAAHSQVTGLHASANGYLPPAADSGDEDDDEEDGLAASSGRRRWPVITTIFAVIAVLVVGGLFIGWRYIQGQYYVNADGSHVTIYRGISQPIAGLHFSSVYLQTTIPASEVPSIIQLPTTPGSLAQAQQTVTTIKQTFTCHQDATAREAWATANSKYQAYLQAKKASKDSKSKKPIPPVSNPGPEPVMASYCAALGVG
jgi:hypothetical protein